MIRYIQYLFTNKKMVDDLLDQIDRFKEANDNLSEVLWGTIIENDELRNTLLKIAKQETKTANATVKRMANIAREGLGK